MTDIAKQMRLLADAVPGPNGGIPYQPIFPSTLRKWAREIERLSRVIDATQFQCNICGELAVDTVDGCGRCEEHLAYGDDTSEEAD